MLQGDSSMSGLRRMGASAVVALASLAAGGVSAAEAWQVRVWAAACATCHGTQGASVGGMPAIAGVDEAKLLSELKEFKAGTKPATVMHQHAKGYTDEELALLAAHFARQRP